MQRGDPTVAPLPRSRMNLRRSRALLILSTGLLAAVALAWLVWPEDPDRADLQAVAPVTAPAEPSTTVAPRPPSTTTTPPEPTAPPPPPAPPTAAPEPSGPVQPTRLRIDDIGVDAAVVSVGLAPDGQMEVPAAVEVGWYRLGPLPGATGSSVMAAHVDFGGRAGAFHDLASVPVGAEVTVEGDGGERRFRVTGREQIAKADIALEDYFTAEGPARLTLITCGGAFDDGIGHYQDNIVITAEPLA